jgi:cation:H+ antiporter
MVAALLPILAWDHVIGRGNGLLLLVAFIAFTISAVYVGRKAPPQDQKEYRQFEEVRGFEPPPEENVWIDVGLVIAGIGVLVLSAHLLVTSAVFFAGVLGISELVVGLTIVAIGTSLPELATSVVAARRSEAEIALGNVVGSNICNILLILGVSGLIRPMTVAPSLMRFEIPVSIAISVALVPLAYPKARLNRAAGIMLLLTYVAFTIAVVVNARG